MEPDTKLDFFFPFRHIKVPFNLALVKIPDSLLGFTNANKVLAIPRVMVVGTWGKRMQEDHIVGSLRGKQEAISLIQREK